MPYVLSPIYVRLFLLLITLGSFTACAQTKTTEEVRIGQVIWSTKAEATIVPNSYCYDDKIALCEIHGRLYTHKAAMTVCPSGWQLPTDQQWQMLEQYLGMDPVFSDSIRIYRGDIETSNKLGQLIDITYGGSGKSKGRKFSGLNRIASYWTATDGPTGKNFALYRQLTTEAPGIYADQAPKATIKSVLCIKIE